MVEKDMENIVDFIDRSTKLCVKAQKKAGKNLNAFMKEIEQDPDLKKLGNYVKVINNIISI